MDVCNHHFYQLSYTHFKILEKQQISALHFRKVIKKKNGSNNKSDFKNELPCMICKCNKWLEIILLAVKSQAVQLHVEQQPQQQWSAQQRKMVFVNRMSLYS